VGAVVMTALVLAAEMLFTLTILLLAVSVAITAK
jgi:hypothetical protein